MSEKPIIDADFDVISGPRLQIEDADALPTGPQFDPATLEPELKGWRLWAAIIVSTLVLTPLAILGMYAVQAVSGWIVHLIRG